MGSFAAYKHHSVEVQTVILSSDSEGSFNLSEILLIHQVKKKKSLEEMDDVPRA